MWEQFYYGVCYYPEHWDAAQHRSDIDRIAACGFDVVRLGEGAWAYWEPEEGRYQFELFDRVIDWCRRRRIRVILGTPTYAAPAWVATKYPEVLRWDFNRQPMRHGSRRVYNYTSQAYLELSDRICTALAEHYRGEDQIIAWQLDNEFNCHMDVSYAPSDTIAFRRWLKDKYKTLDRLNGAWGTAFWSQTYSDWDQIDLPAPTATCLNPSQLLDESRFISDGVIALARRQADILRRYNKRWQITHNALFGNIDGPRFVKVLDFFAHDHYPLFATGDWTEPATALIQARSLSFPFAVMEQQSGPGGQMHYLQPTPRPGQMRLWAWQSIAHGAKLLNYFRWRTCPYGSEQHWHGLLDPDNRDNRRITEAQQVGREIRKLPDAFFNAPVVRCVAVLRDFDNEVNDRRVNTYAHGGRGETDRWLGEFGRRHIPADIVWIDTPDADLQRYRVLIAPHLKIVDRRLAAKLASYARGGGVLVLGAQSGSKDRNGHLVEMPLPGPWRKLAGVEVEDWTMLAEREVRQARLIDGALLSLGTFVERLRPRGAQVVARWLGSDALLGDAPAITRMSAGKGAVYYIGGYCPADAVALLLGHFQHALDLTPVVGTDPSVEAVERADGEHRFIALLNHSDVHQRVSGLCGKDLLRGAKLSGGQLVSPPYGVAIVQVG
jgi:beta-galactosidase